MPKESFLIAGISHHTEDCVGITYETELTMKSEPENKYDPSAIAIYFGDNHIGYVPKEGGMKEICDANLSEPLKVLNIKMINRNYGIRVIPLCFYEHDPVLESQLMFADG
jgi:hypothetical protein